MQSLGVLSLRLLRGKLSCESSPYRKRSTPSETLNSVKISWKLTPFFNHLKIYISFPSSDCPEGKYNDQKGFNCTGKGEGITSC